MTPQRRECSFCVMDTSYPAIQFDAAGQCNCCRAALARKPHEWRPDAAGKQLLQEMATQLRLAGRGKPYDALIGLSGGVDSAYLAHLAVQDLGLRVLAVHVDGGWNSEPAVRNIESLVRKLDIDLFTHVVEWSDMRALQVAFLESSVLNQDIPQDHAFFSTLYRTARRFGIRHFLSGVNFASESIEPPQWGHPAMDGHHARAVFRRFSRHEMRSYEFMNLSEFLWLTRVRKVLTVFKPLNFLDYNKERAKLELSRHYQWRDYGSKHCESRFTKFYQEIYLPRKFGFDKRRLHLSSLIVSGQETRAGAHRELSSPVVSDAQAVRDQRFVAKKLGLSVDRLQSLIADPPIDHGEYPNSLALHKGLHTVRQLFRQARGAS